VFGWQPKSIDEGPVVTAECRACGGAAPWHLYSVTMWISLFFVKVLPTGVEHWLRCAGCGDGMPLSADRNELIRRGDPDDDPTIIGWIREHQRGDMDPGGPVLPPSQSDDQL